MTFLLKKNHFSLIIVYCFTATGCGTIKSELPEMQQKEVPRLIQERSVINLPIQIDLKPHFKEIEKSIPKTFKGEENNCSGVSYSYTMNRFPIVFSAQDNRIDFNVKCAYALNLQYCPGCLEIFSSENCVTPRVYASCGVGEPLRKMEVGLSSTLGINPNWSFSSSTKLKKVEAIDPCKVTFINYNATEELIQEVTASLTELESDIDKSIQEVDLKTSVEKAWDALTQPIDLSGYGLLYLNPEKIALSKLTFDESAAFVDLNLDLQPKVSFVPLLNPLKKLPNLTEYKKSDGFDLLVDIEADYDSLNKILRQEIVGQVFDYNGKKIEIVDFKIHSTRNERINFALTIAGSKKGILYLEGTPKFDSKTQLITMPDLVFDIKTKSAILKSAKWMFETKIEEKLRAAAVYDLRPQLISLKDQIEKELNADLQPGVNLSGKLEKLEIEHIYPYTHQLFMRVKLNGKLGIKM